MVALTGILTLCYIGVSLLDLGFTLWHTHHQPQNEALPWARYVLEHFGPNGFVIYKCLLVCAVLYVINWIEHLDKEAAQRVKCFAIGITFCGVVYWMAIGRP